MLLSELTICPTNLNNFFLFFLFAGYTQRLELGILQTQVNLQLCCKTVLYTNYENRISICCWFPSLLQNVELVYVSFEITGVNVSTFSQHLHKRLSVVIPLTYEKVIEANCCKKSKKFLNRGKSQSIKSSLTCCVAVVAAVAAVVVVETLRLTHPITLPRE